MHTLSRGSLASASLCEVVATCVARIPRPDFAAFVFNAGYDQRERSGRCTKDGPVPPGRGLGSFGRSRRCCRACRLIRDYSRRMPSIGWATMPPHRSESQGPGSRRSPSPLYRQSRTAVRPHVGAGRCHRVWPSHSCYRSSELAHTATSVLGGLTQCQGTRDSRMAAADQALPVLGSSHPRTTSRGSRRQRGSLSSGRHFSTKATAWSLFRLWSGARLIQRRISALRTAD